MNAIVGEDYSLPFHLMVEREYVVPTIDSVSYTVFNNAGSPIAGLTNVAIVTNSTTNRVDVNVSNTAHTVAALKDFEQRTVAVKFSSGGQKYTLRRSYFVTPFLNYRASPEDVLNYLGLLDGELALDQVPLVPAYYYVRDALTPAVFDLAMISGKTNQLHVNDAIKLQAARSFLDTLELRTFKKAGGEGLSFTRFDGIDFDDLRSRVNSDIKTLLGKLTGNATIPTVFVLSAPVDAITGI